MLVDEIAKRTQIELPVQSDWPGDDRPAIGVASDASLDELGGKLAAEMTKQSPDKAEGFRVRSDDSSVVVAGNDERGVLFGIGYLLRHLRMQPKQLALADDLDVNTAPAYPLRGHQLGYRPKTNSYDAWDLAQWEQYYRDLAVFGCNAVELIPPRSDDARHQPALSAAADRHDGRHVALADEYGLDVWIWYPAMDRDYDNPETVERALKEWEVVYKRLPRIDAIFVPGGDPGHTQPVHLMALLEKQTALLTKYHPQAQMWMSPQGFTTEWMEEFYDIMHSEPAWLSGIVFGPQVRSSLPELRRRIPARYPIRHYPDITHSRQASIPCPIGTWRTPSRRLARRSIRGPRKRPRSFACCSRTRSAFSPIPRAATTT